MQEETVRNDYKVKKIVTVLIILLLILVCIVHIIQSIEIVEKTIKFPDLNIPYMDTTNINYNTEPEYIYMNQVKGKKQNRNTKRFYIKDNHTTWNGQDRLNIFRDITHNNRELIVPFSTGLYDFVLVNVNNFKLKANVNFYHNNPYNINIKYRLKQGNTYIVGDNDTYVTINELLLQNISMQKNTQTKYTLEWKWFEDDNDTLIGSLGTAKYELTIEYHAEEII